MLCNRFEISISSGEPQIPKSPRWRKQNLIQQLTIIEMAWINIIKQIIFYNVKRLRRGKVNQFCFCSNQFNSYHC
jgi:hypothetical protein